MFAGKPKIGARFVEFEARFLAACGAVCFDKNRRPNGGIRGPISRDSLDRHNISKGLKAF